MSAIPRRVERFGLASRLRAIRIECFGEDGGPELAHKIGVPERTWDNYECGVSIPGDALLGFLVVTRADPLWLLTGDGPRYRDLPVQGRYIEWA